MIPELKELLGNPGRRESLGHEARALVESTYDWALIASRLAEWLRAIVKEAAT